MKVIKVPGLSYKEIGRIAEKLTQSIFPQMFSSPQPFPIGKFLEFQLEEMTGYSFEVSDNLPFGVEGRTCFSEKSVILSDATYCGMCRGDGRDRFTAAHELGHVVLHADYLKSFQDNGAKEIMLHRGQIQTYCDPDWQAEAFASAILLPKKVVFQLFFKESRSEAEIASVLKTSITAVRTKIEKLERC